jgi:hypothetical protein
MSLLDNAKKEAQVEGTVAAEATPKKKSNSEYQKRQRELAAKYGKQLKDFYGDKIPEPIKEAVEFFSREKKAASAVFGKPVIYKLFGDAPKKGASITAVKVFENTGKGFAEMRQLMKKWAKNNIVVKYDEKAKTYVLDSDVPAYAN